MLHVRDILLNGEPYTPGLSSEHVARTYGIGIDSVAKLGSAENPFGASPKAAAAVSAAMNLLSLYPDWTSEKLRHKIGEKFGFAPEQVVCGAGETELIACIIRAFSEAGERILMYEPCFPVYHLYAINEGRVPVYVPMGSGFEFQIDAYIAAMKSNDVRIAFLTNPHSPTGRLMDAADIERICAAAGDTLVVLDEAYIHFTETPGGLELLRKFGNLIVLRTFSKAYGLAGLRLGFGVAAPDVIRALWNLKPTWNVGHLQVAGGIAALDDDEHVRRTVSMIVEMRAYVAERMSALRAFRMVPGSRANFFLAESLDAGLDSTRVFEQLLRRGVIVKDCSLSFRGLGRRFLRVDVSLKRYMDQFVDGLEDIEQNARRSA